MPFPLRRGIIPAVVKIVVEENCDIIIYKFIQGNRVVDLARGCYTKMVKPISIISKGLETPNPSSIPMRFIEENDIF